MAAQGFDGEESSLVKRQKLSTTKLCAVSKYFPRAGTEVLIGILDLDSSTAGKGFTTQIQLTNDEFRCEGLGFCALGSTLYVFEGLDRKHLSDPMPGNLVFTIDLSSFGDGVGDVKLDKKTVRYTRPLERPKYIPLAIRAPRNKIMVFPMLNQGDSEMFWFEIYDPEGGPSQLLPPLPRLRDHSGGWILSYSFIRDDSEFLVNVDGNILIHDLNSTDKDWQLIYRLGDVCPALPLNGPFYVFEDRFYFTSDGAYDRTVADGMFLRHGYPLKQFGCRQHGPRLIALIGDGYDSTKEECKFCIYRMGVLNEEEEYGKVIVSVCRTGLKRYKEDVVTEEEKAVDVESEVVSIKPFSLPPEEEEEEEEEDGGCEVKPIITEVVNTVEFQLDTGKYLCLTHFAVFVF